MGALAGRTSLKPAHEAGRMIHWLVGRVSKSSHAAKSTHNRQLSLGPLPGNRLQMRHERRAMEPLVLGDRLRGDVVEVAVEDRGPFVP